MLNFVLVPESYSPNILLLVLEVFLLSFVSSVYLDSFLRMMV